VDVEVKLLNDLTNAVPKKQEQIKVSRLYSWHTIAAYVHNCPIMMF